MQTLSCGIWDLQASLQHMGSSAGHVNLGLGPHALGVWSPLDHWGSPIIVVLNSHPGNANFLAMSGSDPCFVSSNCACCLLVCLAMFFFFFFLIGEHDVLNKSNCFIKGHYEYGGEVSGEEKCSTGLWLGLYNTSICQRDCASGSWTSQAFLRLLLSFPEAGQEGCRQLELVMAPLPGQLGSDDTPAG